MLVLALLLVLVLVLVLVLASGPEGRSVPSYPADLGVCAAVAA